MWEDLLPMGLILEKPHGLLNIIIYKQNYLLYEKSQHLTPSILPAKSESLHQCEMNNKVGR